MRKRVLGAGLVAFAGALAIGTLWLAPSLKLAAPGLFGMHCVGRVCVEHPEDAQQALDIVSAAIRDVEAQAGRTVPSLNAMLCRSNDCYRAFGGGDERAISYPFLGMLLAGHSWQDYLVRHELVHWLQFQHFGALETMDYPIWFREGMAYALSGAPDWDIPEPFRPWVAQYRQWQGVRSPAEIFAAQPIFD